MASENAVTTAPTAGEYIQHHLQHLQKDFSFASVKQTSIVDFSLFNLDSLFYSSVLGVLACVLLWMAARKATSGVPGRFQAAVEILVEMVEQDRLLVEMVGQDRLLVEVGKHGTVQQGGTVDRRLAGWPHHDMD